MWLQCGYNYQVTLDTAPAPCYNGGTVKERRAPAESGVGCQKLAVRTLTIEYWKSYSLQ